MATASDKITAKPMFILSCDGFYGPALPITNENGGVRCMAGMAGSYTDKSLALSLGFGFLSGLTAGRLSADTYGEGTSTSNTVNELVLRLGSSERDDFTFSNNGNITRTWTTGRHYQLSAGWLKSDAGTTPSITMAKEDELLGVEFWTGPGLHFKPSLGMQTFIFHNFEDAGEGSTSPFGIRLMLGLEFGIGEIGDNYYADEGLSELKIARYLAEELFQIPYQLLSFFDFYGPMDRAARALGQGSGGSAGSLQFMTALRMLVSAMNTRELPNLVKAFYDAEKNHKEDWMLGFLAIEAIKGFGYFIGGAASGDGGATLISSGTSSLNNALTLFVNHQMDVSDERRFITPLLLGALEMLVAVPIGKDSSFASGLLSAAGETAAIWTRNPKPEIVENTLASYSPVSFRFSGDLVGQYNERRFFEDSPLMLEMDIISPAASAANLGNLTRNSISSPIDAKPFHGLDASSVMASGAGVGDIHALGESGYASASIAGLLVSEFADEGSSAGLGVSAVGSLGVRIGENGGLGLAVSALATLTPEGLNLTLSPSIEWRY